MDINSRLPSNHYLNSFEFMHFLKFSSYVIPIIHIHTSADEAYAYTFIHKHMYSNDDNGYFYVLFLQRAHSPFIYINSVNIEL